MARSHSKIGNKEKALIHVAKGQLGLSEEDYRAMLKGVGVESSRDLDQMQFEDLMKRFEAVGFKSKKGAHRSWTDQGQTRRARRRADDPKAPLIRKIAAMLLDQDLPEAYANGIAKRMFGVVSYLWLDQEQLWKVVAALSYRKKRGGGAASRDKSAGSREHGAGRAEGEV